MSRSNSETNPSFEIDAEETKRGMVFPSPLSLLHVLWLRKWVILVLWACLSFPTFILLSIFNLPRSYLAATVLRFPSVVGAQTNVMRDIAITQGESIISIFNSFQVLNATIEKLSLRMHINTPEVFRREVFESITYSPKLGLGQYHLSVGSAGEVHLRYRPRGGREDVPLFKGQVADDLLTIPGLELKFAPGFLHKARNLSLAMELIGEEEEVKSLRESMTIRPMGGANFQVTMKDRDPYLVADMLNVLRDEFLSVYYGTTEVQNVGVLAQMEKDLEVAKQRLERSQDDVSKFYASHPELVAQERTPNVSDNLAYLESRQDIDLTQSRRDRVDAAFKAKPAEGQSQERYFWASELLSAMAEAGEPKANILRSRLAELENQLTALRAQLGQGHPRIQEIEVQKSEVYLQMEQAESDLIRKLEKHLGDLRVKMVRSAPTAAPSIPVKVRLELDRLNSVNANNQTIYDRVLEAYNRAKLVTGSEFFKVTIVDVARPALYTPPSLKSRILIAGAAVCFLFVLVPVIFGAYVMVFQKVFTRDDVKRLLKAKLLGSISHGANRPKKTADSAEGVESLLLFYGDTYKLEDLESYRLIREESESFFRNPKHPDRMVLLVTSTQPGEGKTLSSSNLALTFARKGKRTLLIDADFRLGRVAKVFNATPSTGLDEMLSQADLSMDEFLSAASLCFVPSLQNGLVLVPRKVSNPNAGEMVSSERFKSFVRLAREQFDVVIIDSPPMMITPEPLSLAELVDGVLFVTRSGLTSVGAAKEALQILGDRRVKVGIILNGVNHSPFEDNRYKKYSYYYREGAKQLVDDRAKKSRASGDKPKKESRKNSKSDPKDA